MNLERCGTALDFSLCFFFLWDLSKAHRLGAPAMIKYDHVQVELRLGAQLSYQIWDLWHWVNPEQKSGAYILWNRLGGLQHWYTPIVCGRYDRNRNFINSVKWSVASWLDVQKAKWGLLLDISRARWIKLNQLTTWGPLPASMVDSPMNLSGTLM